MSALAGPGLDVIPATQTELPWQFVDADGNITDTARIQFTTHTCWYLAWVLHEKTGWPIVAVTDSDISPNGGVGWVHVLVEEPGTGHLIDVEGAHLDGEVLDQWEPYCEGPEEVDLLVVSAADFTTRLSEDPAAVSSDFAAATDQLADALLEFLKRH